MNSKVKGIVICAVIVLCLGATLLVLKLTDNKSDSSSVSEESSSAAETVPLMSDISDELDKSMISSIKIKNQNDEFTVKRESADGESWGIDALDGIDQSDTIYSALANTVAGLSAEKLVEDGVSDFAKYGLDSPQAVVDAKFENANTGSRTISVGDMTPDSKCYYIRLDDSDKVYSLASGTASYFFYAKEDFISVVMVETPASDDDYPDIEQLTIKQKGVDYDVVIKTRSDSDTNTAMASSQVMTEPIFAYLDVTNSSSITHGMWGLSASNAVAAFPDKDDFKKYGINDPTAKVILKTSEGTYTLTIGDPVYSKDSEGKDTTTVESYYTYLEGVDGKDVIFKVLSDSLPWATAVPSDYISGLMTYNAATDLKSVVVKEKDKTTRFELSSSVDESVETDEDEEPTMKLDSVTLDGESLDVEAWKGWYQYLLQCPTSEMYFEEPENESYLSVSINRSDGGGDTLEFFRDTNRRTIVKLNSKTSFRIETSYVEKLLSNMQLAIEGKEVNSDI